MIAHFDFVEYFRFQFFEMQGFYPVNQFKETYILSTYLTYI